MVLRFVDGLEPVEFQSINFEIGVFDKSDTTILHEVANLMLLRHNRIGDSRFVFKTHHGKSYEGNEDGIYDAVCASTAELQVFSVSRYNNRSAKGFAEGFEEFGFSEQLDIEYFASCNGVEAKFLTSEETERTLVIFEAGTQEDSGVLSLCGALFPRLVSWRFKETPADHEELELLKSMIGKNPDMEKFRELMTNMEESPEYRRAYLPILTSGFANKIYSSQIGQIMEDICSMRSNIRDRENEILTMYEEMEDLQIKYEGLKVMADRNDENNELTDFLINTRSVKVIGTKNGILEIITTGFLSIFDPDTYELCVSNQSSVFNRYDYSEFSPVSDFESVENRRIILDGIFKDESIKLKMVSNYRLSSRGFVRSKEGFLRYYPRGYFPNPHILFYGCLGDYGSLISRSLSEGDMVGAMNQAIASCCSVNLSESITMEKMIGLMFSSSYAEAPILVYEGIEASPVEVLIKIKEERGLQNEAN